jgi:putative hemolysin
MELISKNQLKELIHYNRLGKNLFAEIIFQVLKLDRINKIYDENFEKNPSDFIDAILNQLDIQFEVSKSDINRIPLKPQFIIISNHPFNIIDELIIYKVFSQIHPNIKIISNNILQKVTPLQDSFFTEKYFDTKKIKDDNISELLEHIYDENPLCIFPAGNNSTFDFSEHRFNDDEWKNNILKFIVNCEVPIIPVYISGTNNIILNILGKIHPLIKAVKLPSELLNKKDKKIKLRIGNQITVEQLSRFLTTKETGRYLRSKVYALSNSLEIDNFYKKPIWGIKKKVEPIHDEISASIIENEINEVKKHSLLFELSSYSVICASTDKIPNTIIEIGRLREKTFREVGEGTNKSLDLDQYDVYYQHLIIWDNSQRKIVGSYRIGKGKDIIRDYGIKGLYIRSLFKINPAIKPTLEESLELGRSFIVKEYQKKTLPLFLLWKGIFHFLLENKEYRYLIGPVSISNDFSKFTKSLIVSFVKSNYYEEELAHFIQPRKRFNIPKKHMPKINFLVNEMEDDLNIMDNIIHEIEDDKRVPVLLKKYLSLNAKIIGFNVDPLFNDCLDGLIILDLFNIPENVLESLSKDLENEKSRLSEISLMRNKLKTDKLKK